MNTKIQTHKSHNRYYMRKLWNLECKQRWIKYLEFSKIRLRLISYNGTKAKQRWLDQVQTSIVKLTLKEKLCLETRTSLLESSKNLATPLFWFSCLANYFASCIKVNYHYEYNSCSLWQHSGDIWSFSKTWNLWMWLPWKRSQPQMFSQFMFFWTS
jgi:hypothetical protein